MWSQYGDEHRGICLTYEIPDSFILDPSTSIIGRAPVRYGKEPLTKWIAKNAADIDMEDPRDFAIEVMKKLLIVKAKDWKYEKEYRVIRIEAGPLSIPVDFLTQACFGLRTPDEDRNLVLDALDQRGGDTPVVRIDKTRSNFGLHPVEL